MRKQNIIIGIVIIIIIAGVAYAMSNSKKATAPTVNAPKNTGAGTICTMDAMQCSDGSYVGRSGPNCQFVCPNSSTNPGSPIIPGATSTSTPAIKNHTVSYSDIGFSPSTVLVNVGDSVTFRNTSGVAFWPASNDHPTHLLYPEFDAKKSIPPGESWTFTFTKKGSWGYHNHLKPGNMGTIVVN